MNGEYISAIQGDLEDYRERCAQLQHDNAAAVAYIEKLEDQLVRASQELSRLKSVTVSDNPDNAIGREAVTYPDGVVGYRLGRGEWPPTQYMDTLRRISEEARA